MALLLYLIMNTTCARQMAPLDAAVRDEATKGELPQKGVVAGLVLLDAYGARKNVFTVGRMEHHMERTAAWSALSPADGAGELPSCEKPPTSPWLCIAHSPP